MKQGCTETTFGELKMGEFFRMNGIEAFRQKAANGNIISYEEPGVSALLAGGSCGGMTPNHVVVRLPFPPREVVMDSLAGNKTAFEDWYQSLPDMPERKRLAEWETGEYADLRIGDWHILAHSGIYAGNFAPKGWRSVNSVLLRQRY